MAPDQAEPIRIFVCGDVMTGRGIDQALPHPVAPVLYESLVRDARDYVQLAEDASGPIPRPLDFAYIWGDALDALQRAGTDARIINLETSITSCPDAWPAKAVHYRMHPRNVGCLTAARLDCCCLANNHVLDWGYGGLEETIRTLDAAGIAHAGAGRDLAAAASPAVIDLAGKGRVLVFALGSPSSGIPPEWGATATRPGVNLLADLSAASAQGLLARVRERKQPGDVVVASIHWGPNWGYAIPEAWIAFAHRLVEGGVDVVHGHSSHHVKALELYRGRPILYGCGDLLDDYEGIAGYEAFRPDWRLLYLLALDPRRGRLSEARLIPMALRRFQLQRASAAEASGLCQLLNRLGEPFDTAVQREPDDSLSLLVSRP